MELTETEARCKVEVGGELSDKKSMSFPGKVLKQKFLSSQDEKDILFGIENDVDYIAASFVSSKQDIMDIKALLDSNGGSSIGIIAKIENQSGVDNIIEICEECEGIMIARGDLGVEIPFKELPAIQKHLTKVCRFLGKRVITATEMLESMKENPRPTRAEISDVANAVYDNTSAVMLSAESAVGKYPVKTVETMASICEETEKNINYDEVFLHTDFTIKNNMDAVSHAACNMALGVSAKAIAVCSMSGTTVRMLSRFRPSIDIIGFTTEEKAWRKLSLSWGVRPILTREYPSPEVAFFYASQASKDILKLVEGDNIIIVGSTTSGKTGKTDTIRLESVH